MPKEYIGKEKKSENNKTIKLISTVLICSNIIFKKLTRINFTNSTNHDYLKKSFRFTSIIHSFAAIVSNIYLCLVFFSLFSTMMTF